MTISTLSEYDVIIAGGGATACVIAGRLAAADPLKSILILEAGPPTRDDLAHVQPARYLNHLLPESTTVKFNVGNESEYLGGRSPIVPCGQCLGGGSSVNFTMYTRPSASDYDDWEHDHGNPGWGSKDIIPCLQRAETYQVQGGTETHGYEGPIKISYGGIFTNLGQEFLSVAAQYDPERSFTDDPNGLFECNSYGRWLKYIDAETGRRSDAAHNYIYKRNYKNLKIMTGFLVKRVLFKEHRAVGVEFLPNQRFHPDLPQDVQVALARELVVVSSGAMGSPGILERSGIGSQTILQDLGINVVVDLPGVGENYRDHNVMFVSYLADDDVDTLDGIVNSDQAELEKWSSQWIKDGSGLMAHNGIDAGIRWRPSPEELDVIGPEFQETWQRYYNNAPDKPPMWIGAGSMYVGDPSTRPDKKCFCMIYFLNYPRSVGYIHITSADDVTAAADFDPKFMSWSEDIALLRWSYKRTREFARRLPSYRGEHVVGHPMFSPDSPAACRSDASPVSISAPDIQYSGEDDEAIDAHTRKAIATAWHSLGTCAMKAQNKRGVVDPRLNVYGVTGLKVADMSIAPANVSANTYSTALAIGERAAAIIIEEICHHVSH